MCLCVEKVCCVCVCRVRRFSVCVRRLGMGERECVYYVAYCTCMRMIVHALYRAGFKFGNSLILWAIDSSTIL